MEVKRQKIKRKSLLYGNENHAANLNNMRLNNKWCDITIRVNGMEYHAHKVVLGANLKFFGTMLSNDLFKESNQDVIVIEGVKGSDLEAFLSYAYTGAILLTDSNALSFLELATYLGEDDIKVACIEFLSVNLRKEEACRAYQFANTIDCLLLKNVAKMTILANFQDCSQTSDYLDFDFGLLIDILSDVKAQPVDSHQKYFEGIMRWIMFDVVYRRIRLNDLLNSIDIAQLTADYLLDHLYRNVVYSNDEHCILKDVMFCYYSNKIQQKKSQALMLVGFESNNLIFQFCNLAKKKWSTIEEVPCFHDQNYSRGVVLNDEFYYYGENPEGVYLNVFDPTTKRNSVLHSSNSILSLSALCSYKKCLYLCGGRINKELKSINQVLKYDPLTSSLETLPPMRTGRSFASATFYQGFLHVLGGSSDSNVYRSVEKYDPNTNEWMTFPSMCVERTGIAVVVLDDKLYACGGHNKKSVEVYDSSKHRWQLVASMNKQRYCGLVVAHEGKLLAIGGDEENTIEVYDPSRDEWQIDHQLASGLQIKYPQGGFIPLDCIPNAD